MITRIFQRKYLIRFVYLLVIVSQCGESKRTAKLPDYLHLCKKSDPQLNKCVVELFESLRPHLDTGIPEILPPLDPLLLPEIVIMAGGHGQPRALVHDVLVRGVKNIQIRKIEVDIKKLEIKAKVHFPLLIFEGVYDVNAKFVNIPVKGKGPMKGNATEVTADAVLKGKMVEQDGDRFVEFTNAVVDVTLVRYRIRVDKLFQDRKLNDAVNNLLNDRNVQHTISVKPLMNKIAGDMLLSMVNKISNKLSFEEIFA